MPAGYQNARRAPECPQGTGCPGCGGALVPPRGLLPPPAAAQGPARRLPAWREGEDGTGLLVQRSRSSARQPQRLQTGSARRSGVAGGAPRSEAGELSAPLCSAVQLLLGQSCQYFLLLLLPRGTRVPLHPYQLLGRAGAFRESGSEQSLPLSSWGMSPDPPAGTGWDFIAVAQANSLAGILLTPDHTREQKY